MLLFQVIDQNIVQKCSKLTLQQFTDRLNNHNRSLGSLELIWLDNTMFKIKIRLKGKQWST
jgi:hypothetical protein